MLTLHDWRLLTGTLKAWGHWRCWRCGLQGLLPGERSLDRAERARRALQVHHRNRDRTNNALYNLEVVCSGCHLGTHRGERFGRRVVVGQLSLALALTATKTTTPTLRPLRVPFKVLSPDRELCQAERTALVEGEQLTLV